MEPFEWIVAGAVVWAVFPRFQKAVANTWSSMMSTANETVQGVGRTTTTAVNQTQNMCSPDQQ